MFLFTTKIIIHPAKRNEPWLWHTHILKKRL